MFANQYFATGSGDGVAEDYSQEVRLRYDRGRLSALIGAFYLKIDRHRTSTFGGDTSMLLPNETIPFATYTTFGTTDPINRPVINSIVVSTETEKSLFGGLQYKLTDALRINVEARRRVQDQDIRTLRTGANNLVPPRVQKATFKNWTPRFSVGLPGHAGPVLLCLGRQGHPLRRFQCDLFAQRPPGPHL